MTEILCCKALKNLEGSTADVDLVNLDKVPMRLRIQNSKL